MLIRSVDNRFLGNDPGGRVSVDYDGVSAVWTSSTDISSKRWSIREAPQNDNTEENKNQPLKG